MRLGLTGEDIAYEAVRWACIAAMASVAYVNGPSTPAPAPCLAGETGEASHFSFAGRIFAASWACVDGARILHYEGSGR